MTDLLNYDTSWLNPALKFVIAGIFLFVSYTYYRAKRNFAGDILKVLNLLAWMATAEAIAAILRYFGHGTQFGFTAEYSLKWFQTLAHLAQAILFVLVPWYLAKGIIPEIRE